MKNNIPERRQNVPSLEPSENIVCLGKYRQLCVVWMQNERILNSRDDLVLLKSSCVVELRSGRQGLTCERSVILRRMPKDI